MTAAGMVTASEIVELRDRIAQKEAKVLVDCTSVTRLPGYGDLRHGVIPVSSKQRVAIVCQGALARGGMRMIATVYLYGSDLQLFETVPDALLWLDGGGRPEA